MAHLAWKKGSVAEGQLLISHFSIKLNFLLGLEIDRWILRCCQSITSAKFCRYAVYRQYLLIKAVTIVLCMECTEIVVAASSMINYRKFFVFFLMMRSPPTASSSAQYSDHSAIVPINRSIKFAFRFCAVSRWLPANKALVFDYRILVTQVCTKFHVTRFFMGLTYCLSTVVWVL